MGGLRQAQAERGIPLVKHHGCPSAGSGQALRQAQDRPFGRLRTGPSAGSGQALRQAQDRPFGRLRTGPSAGSGQALRQAQDRPFGRLRTGPSAGSGQALRQAQDRPFGRLRTGPSAGSGQALRQAQDRPFGRLRTGPSAGSGQVCGAGGLRPAQGRTEQLVRGELVEPRAREFLPIGFWEGLFMAGLRQTQAEQSGLFLVDVRRTPGRTRKSVRGEPFGKLRTGLSS